MTPENSDSNHIITVHVFHQQDKLHYAQSCCHAATRCDSLCTGLYPRNDCQKHCHTEDHCMLVIADRTRHCFCRWPVLVCGQSMSALISNYCPRLLSTTCRIRSTGAGVLVNSSNCSAACPMNISTPLTVLQPTALASCKQNFDVSASNLELRHMKAEQSQWHGRAL